MNTHDLAKRVLLKIVLAHFRVAAFRQGVFDPTVCGIPLCGETSKARGLCGRHYQRWRRDQPLIDSEDRMKHVSEFLTLRHRARFRSSQPSLRRST